MTDPVEAAWEAYRAPDDAAIRAGWFAAGCAAVLVALAGERPAELADFRIEPDPDLPAAASATLSMLWANRVIVEGIGPIVSAGLEPDDDGQACIRWTIHAPPATHAVLIAALTAMLAALRDEAPIAAEAAVADVVDRIECLMAPFEPPAVH